jgi:hypothetical protein
LSSVNFDNNTHCLCLFVKIKVEIIVISTNLLKVKKQNN